MNRADHLLAWLENTSDWLSPIVVKEVRQVVRGREFMFSFGASLVAGLGVAFFGAADALTGTGTTGRWTFGALMGCLTLLGFVIVPFSAFNALRVERLEQTLDLITLTALTPRRVVLGKLLAQAVKLGTLFAGMAPFIAMSFLLGGVDFPTIFLALGVLFMWSLWASAASLFLSSLVKSRAMMGLVFIGAAILALIILFMGRMLFFFVVVGSPMTFYSTGASSGGATVWWALAMMTTVWLTTIVNLVLLAENRLSLPTENRVTALRVGFLVQFLVIVGWILSFINEPSGVRSDALEGLGVIGGVHLALVAMFTVTEDLLVPRRAMLLATTSSRWGWLLAMFYPGGGRGAIYVLVHMAIFLSAAALFRPDWMQFRWFLAICGYICFFTGTPVFAFRLLRPEGAASLRLRIALLVVLVLSFVLPDLVYYVVWQPQAFNLSFSARHLLSPLATLANWTLVEARQWLPVPFAIGTAGLVTYVTLIHMGLSITAEEAPTDPESSSAKAGEPDRANVLY